MSIARLMQVAAAGNVPSGPVWTDPDLGNASYDSVSFSVSGQETSPTDLFISSDGTSAYLLGNEGDDVNEYSLSTAWDISTASYVTNFSVSGQDATPFGFFFKPDGTKMYVLGYTSDAVHQYSLSTAWDLSTASYDSVSFSVSSQDTIPSKLLFSEDGTTMYVVGLINKTVFQYSLSTAWDLSTASYASKSYSYASFGNQGYGIRISPSGDKFFFLERDSKTVYQLSFGTNFDISTLTYDSVSFSVSSQELNPQALVFKSDGSKMYTVGPSTNTIYQYSTA